MNEPVIGRRTGVVLGLLLGVVALAVPVAALLTLPGEVAGGLRNASVVVVSQDGRCR
ncbi:hypothetical protein [Streptomyces rhizosphaericus]|uniref:hypothetical protein n=1 Tax=Streptomyces rhizosphaericus TaxID=114699 RepID=UPI00142D2720|nr:hypothetical protein [Streptomyces rhizosphaericus]